MLEDTPQYAVVERVFKITNANRTDAGKYECDADSTLEKANTSTILIVYCEYTAVYKCVLFGPELKMVVVKFDGARKTQFKTGANNFSS